jgi:carboxyl-terminal processing protease
MILSRPVRERLLSRIDALVSAKFYDPLFNGKDWKQIVAKNRDAVLNADSNTAFEAAIMNMLAEMHATGLGLLSPDTEIAPRNSINASFRAIETTSEGLRWVFQDVLPGGVAQRAGLRSGDALITVDGIEMNPPNAPAFHMNRKIPIVVSQTDGRRSMEIDLTTLKPKYQDNPYSEPTSLVADMCNNTIGTMKVSLFPGLIGIDFANAVSTIISDKLKSSNRLVIDLRGNPGGGIGGLRLMSYLTPVRSPIGYSVDRVTVERGYSKDELPRFHHIPRSKFELPLLAIKFWGKKSIVLETEGLGKRPFHSRTVVLVNEHTTGAAEMLTQFAQENELATIVGTRTPGKLVSRSAFKIGEGYRLVVPIAAYLSWTGKQIEGTGITPDIAIDWSYEDALKGVDNQYNRALEVAESL